MISRPNCARYARYARKGGAVVILFVLVIAVSLSVVGFGYFQGKGLQEKQAKLLSDGYKSFNENKMDDAYKLFISSKITFSDTLDFYRKFHGTESLVTTQEVSDLILNTCLAAAYERLFKLKESEEWVSRAEKELKGLKDDERKKELTSFVATARASSSLCKTYNDGKYKEAMLDLLKVEKNSQPTDQDFFIFEIRFLIACGKALGDNLILAQARELLFFATTDAGIDNDKTKSLWGILTN